MNSDAAKIGIALVVFILLIVGVSFVMKSQQSKVTTTQEQTASSTPPSTAPSITQQPAETVPAIVSHGDAGFVPSVVKIAKGKTVMFINDGTASMWPASAKHPTHNEYPTKGGCTGSTLDACKALAHGESWSFQFDQVGSWNYHNHLNPSQTGTIIVE